MIWVNRTSICNPSFRCIAAGLASPHWLLRCMPFYHDSHTDCILASWWLLLLLGGVGGSSSESVRLSMNRKYENSTAVTTTTLLNVLCWIDPFYSMRGSFKLDSVGHSMRIHPIVLIGQSVKLNSKYFNVFYISTNKSNSPPFATHVGAKPI